MHCLVAQRTSRKVRLSNSEKSSSPDRRRAVSLAAIAGVKEASLADAVKCEAAGRALRCAVAESSSCIEKDVSTGASKCAAAGKAGADTNLELSGNSVRG